MATAERLERGAALRRVREALEAVGSRCGASGDWTCPAHEDRSPSLSLNQGDVGALVHCHAGCNVEAVLEALGLVKADLFDRSNERRPAPGRPRSSTLPREPRRISDYVYVDRMGEPLARKVRLEPGPNGRTKSFIWEVPTRNGWRAAAKGEGNPGILYHLPEVVEADEVHVGEGEKAADALAEIGVTATCSPAGEPARYAEALRGKRVVVWMDRDEPGRKKAAAWVLALHGVARSVSVVRSATRGDHDDAHDHLAAGLGLEDAEPVPIRSLPGCEHLAPPLDELAFSGPRILGLLDRNATPAVEAGVPTPGNLTLLVAPSMTGKTSLAAWSAISEASGVPEWDGARQRSPGRVLFVSLDEAPEQLARRLRGLSLFHPAGNLEKYADRLSLIGPDRELAADALDALRLDESGLAIIDRWLSQAEVEGAPFTLLVVDAYADVLPLGETENSNEVATIIGGGLQRLAVRHGLAVQLLHHAGKPKPDAGAEPDVRFHARGASALAAKARVVQVLEPVSGMPHLRRIRTATNLGRPPNPALFQVCAPEAESGELIFFRPHDVAAAHQPEDYLGPDQEVSTRDLAWRLTDADPETGGEPPGEARRMAARLREEWRRAGVVEVVPGPRNAKLIRLPRSPRRP